MKPIRRNNRWSPVTLISSFLLLTASATWGKPDPPAEPQPEPVALESLPALERIVRDETERSFLRYQATRALLAVRAERAPELLASGADPVRAAVIDQLGDSGRADLEASLAEMLGNPESHRATLTGDALARLQLSREYQEFWAKTPDRAGRLRFLLDRLGEMYVHPPPPASPTLRDDPVGRWLQRALGDLAAENMQELIAALEERVAQKAANGPLAEKTLRLFQPQ